jgi:aspartate aminotransferase
MNVSRRVQEIEESATLAVTERAARLKAEGVDVLSLAAGEPDFDTPEHIQQAATDAMKKGLTKYTASSGILPLRKAVAKKYEREMGLVYDPSQALISTGGKHSLFNVLHAVLDPGDECLIPAPYWVSYPEMVKTTGARPVILPTDEASGFKLKPDAIRKAVTPKTRAIVLCSPSNPTGIVYAEAELREMAEVLEKTDLWVISDEVYEKMVYPPARHVSIATVTPKMRERTVIVNSCSKTYAMTGWRVGFMVGPKPVLAGAAKIQSQSTSNPNSIAQHAALAALEGDQTCVATMMAEYARRREVVVRRLRAIPGLSCAEPWGAFYAFPNVSALYGRSAKGRKIDSSGAMGEALIEQAHLAVVPGGPFGSDAHLRLSYAASTEALGKAVDRLERFVKEML